MINRFMITVFIIALCSQTQAQTVNKQPFTYKTNTIIIEGEIPEDYYNSVLPNAPQRKSSAFEMESTPFDYVGVYPEMEMHQEIIENGNIKWILTSDRPLLLISSYLRQPMFAVPGDSIHISSKDGKPVYSGRGAKTFQLEYKISLIRSQKPP